MKLKRLIIHNIASIEDAEIDFDAKPLSDCEVFLITGRTGSGKTTVLDAICLALYNMAPRMKNSDMGGFVDDYDERSLGVNDCRNFLRRATGKGSVRLVFVGNDSHEYEAEWTVRRSRDKANGRLQPSQHILTDLTATESWRKENDIKAQIQRIVGLDFEQFCRTSMLAQGEFSRFLNSSDDQKSIILEKITGVKSFSRIGETIFNLSKEHQEKYNIILDRIKQIGILDKEAVARLHAERKDATDCLNALRGKYDSAIKKREWLRECFRLRDKLAGFKTERAISDEYSILTGAVECLRSKAKLRSERQSELKLKLDSYIPVKDVLDNSAGIIERIRRQTGLASQVADISGLVSKKEEALRINSEKHKEYIQAFDDACGVMSVTEKQLAEHEQELASKRLPELYDRRNALNVRKAEVDRLQERLEQLKAETTAFERDRAALKDKQAGLERLEKELVGLQATEKAYAEAEATLRKTYDIVRQQGEQWVESCRHKLQTGDMCPVCLRVIESSLPSDKEVYERNIYPVEKAHADAECRLKEARRTLDEA
ncbi:MAG: SMC family ATPase, partial [Muribaculaceae bacterium]|nr:SMC family ATPase [Muribaculaceae bacterium]